MKERLTGAIILVALIVLLVPELLTGPLRGKPTAGGGVPDTSLEGPPARPSLASRSLLRSSPTSAASAAAGGPSSQAEPPLRSYTLSLTNSVPVHAAGANAPVATGGPARPASAAPAPSVARPTSSPPSTPSRSIPVAAASQGRAPAPRARAVVAGRPAVAPRTRVAGGWVVQLGSFSRHSNALRLAHRLRGKGFPASVSPSRWRGRVLWRVRVGPASSRSAAAHLARRLRSIGLRGEVLPG